MDEAAVDGTVAPLQTGDPRRLGSYALIGRLGVGGQGAVFLGRSEQGTQVAIKLLHPQLTEDTDARGRFVREAMAAKRVARFCAAQVLDVQVAGDRPYIVSEYVSGPPLQRLVKQSGPLTDGALERLAIGTATALVAIHQAGVVHRDLKPANVLIGPDGPRVIDFGIAKALTTTATASSRVVGTPAYMAPEQLRGASIDPSVDVFAWGAMMTFVATGSPPFGTDSIVLVAQRILAAEPDLGDMAEPLRGLVRDCLAKEPAARPTARQILHRLLTQDGVAIGGQTAPVGGQTTPMVAPMAAPMAASIDRADTFGTEVLAQAAILAAGEPTVAALVQEPGPVERRPVGRRPAFVAVGLAVGAVVIAALLLAITKPYGSAHDGQSPNGGTSVTSPAGQSEVTGGGQPMGNIESHGPSTPPASHSTYQNTGGNGTQSGNGGTPTASWTPTPTPTWTPTPTSTWTPTWTPTPMSTGDAGGTGGGNGSDHGITRGVTDSY